MRRIRAPEVEYDEEENAIILRVDDEKAVRLPCATVRRSDRSAAIIDEYTGKPKEEPDPVPDDIRPVSIETVGNYALSISWEDGFSQLSPFDQLMEL